MKVLTSPSIFAADLMHLEDEIKKTVNSGADMIHFDVMDGVYVPNISLGFDFLKSIRKITDLPIDVHMMTVRPEAYIDLLSAAGADIVTIHSDIADEDKIKTMLMDIRSYGMMAAIALKPAVPAEKILPYIDMVDHVLVFAGKLGVQGSPADMMQTEKIPLIRNMKPEVEIGWDGGANMSNVRALAHADLDVINVGAAISQAENPAAAFQELVAEIDKNGVVL